MVENAINLKLLFAQVLKKWRTILIVGVIFAALLCGMKTIRGRTVMSQEEYEEAMNEYKEQKEMYTGQIERLNSSLEDLYAYANESILVNINPYDEIRTRVVIYPILNDGESDTKQAQLTHRLMSYIVNGVNYERIAQECNKSEKTIRELVTADITQGGVFVNAVTVTVIGTDRQITEKINSLIIEEVKKTNYEADFGIYTLAFSGVSTVSVVDEYLAISRTNVAVHNRKMSLLEENINSIKTELETQEASLAGLKEPVRTTGISKKSLVKYGMLGFAVGVVLAFMFMALLLVLMNPIQSEMDLQLYYHIKTLCVISEECKGNVIDRWLCKISDTGFGTNKEVALSKAVVGMAASGITMKRVLITGVNEDDECVIELAQKLQALSDEVKYIPTTNVNFSVEDLEKLNESDGVVIVVKREKNTHEQVRKVLDTLSNSGTLLLGSIVL